MYKYTIQDIDYDSHISVDLYHVRQFNKDEFEELLALAYAELRDYPIIGRIAKYLRDYFGFFEIEPLFKYDVFEIGEL